MADKWEPDETDLITVAINLRLHQTNIAKHFGICKDTLYQYYTRRPDVKKKIEALRAYIDADFLDKAQDVVWRNMDNMEKPELAQRAAEKVLDKIGHRIGWGPKPADVEVETENQAENIKELLTELRQRQPSPLSRLASDLKSIESSCNNDK